MGLFSERNNFKPVRVEIQIESIDDRLRTHLWNTTLEEFVKSNIYKNGNQYSDFSKIIWSDFFVLPLNSMPYDKNDLIVKIHEIFTNGPWYFVYDLIEFILNVIADEYFIEDFSRKINYYLEKEMSAYRLIAKNFVQVTTEIEIKSIETAINSEGSNSSIEIHIKRALGLMSDRQNPDYRNSIKESISAVEALCIEITGNPKATLGQALKQIEKSTDLHKSLQSAFSSLYGYTSEADGIRHAMLDESTLKQEDALFMLVSCSAFVNYLKMK
jgi:hypothetical protein